MRAIVATIMVGSLLLLTACDACQGRDTKRKVLRQKDRTESTQKQDECTVAADCADDDDDPCTSTDCEDGLCVTSLSPAGTKCDNGNVCDGIETCDKEGRCIPSSEPAPTDDGNACTLDYCDPVRGVSHQPVAVDDHDSCTVDACDPRTGNITHDSIPVDDGDPCTTDSCDPRIGVQHQQPNPFYTCDAACTEGFHSTSKTPAQQCGGPEGLRNFCTPNCGASFYTCDLTCPKGYQKRSEARGGQCGPGARSIVFCVKG